MLCPGLEFGGSGLTPYRTGVQFAIRRWARGVRFSIDAAAVSPAPPGYWELFAMSYRRSSPYFIHCALVTLALAACQPTIDQRGNLPDEKKISEIEPGVTTKEAVSQLLG